MKFCKRYEEYMKERNEKKLPALGLKMLKKTLKRCRRDFRPQHQLKNAAEPQCPRNCSVCDGTFFPSLLKEMSAVVGCFNRQAQKLLQLHLASGYRKYITWLKGKTPRKHGALIQEGKHLVAYAIINSIAMRKILKKYDKIHYSNQGQAFRSKALTMHIEILQSPWLCELLAFHINMREGNTSKKALVEVFDDCSIKFDDDGKPTLCCDLFDSMKIETELTCSICLEIVFDPVALSCGHLFCYMCCCSAASVTIVEGLKSASSTAKCPLCRLEGVYPGAVHLQELKILLRKSCPEYYKKREQCERLERIRQSKEYWQSLSRAFVGI